MPYQKRILILQHIEENPPGLIGNVIHQHGIEFDVAHVTKQALPDPTEYEAVVVVGGSQHVYDMDKKTFGEQEEQLIRTTLDRDIPFLGVCLGSELLAHVIGGEVKRHTPPEMGFVRIDFTEQGKVDPFYQGLPGYQQGFHWHEDVFDIPSGATLLSYSPDDKHQGFRCGRRAYGVQYHLELTPEMLDEWLHDPQLKQEFISVRGNDAYSKIEQEQYSLYPLYHEHATTVITNFLRLSELL